MTYDLETKLREHLTERGWDQRDIRAAVRRASSASTLKNALAAAEAWKAEAET